MVGSAGASPSSTLHRMEPRPGSGSRLVINHPAAAFCIQLPMLEVTVASQRIVNVLYRNGLHAAAAGLPADLEEVDTIAAYRDDHRSAMPRAQFAMATDEMMWSGQLYHT